VRVQHAREMLQQPKPKALGFIGLGSSSLRDAAAAQASLCRTLVFDKERLLKTDRQRERPVCAHNCSSFAWTYFQSGIPLKQASFARHCPGPLKQSMTFVSCSSVSSAVRVDVFCDSVQEEQLTMPMHSHTELGGGFLTMLSWWLMKAAEGRSFACCTSKQADMHVN